MLKRITKIQNIGRFKQAHCPRIHFGKITLIFGRNTYGKSTLGDLFNSIATTNTDIIKARKTLPLISSDQIADISFHVDGDVKEKTISFKNGEWQQRLPLPLKLLVFDDGFYHNNVFSSRSFTRSTKENFSSYVIGSQGVEKAQEIGKKNKEKRAKTTDRNKLEKAAFKDIGNIDEFIKITCNDSLEQLTESLNKKRSEYDGLNKQKNNAQSILAKNNFSYLSWSGDFKKSVSSLNICLNSSLQNHHEKATVALAEHLTKNFKTKNNAESWIRQGLEQNLGLVCQFCGQNLEEPALSLLQIYRQSFDNAFENHSNIIKTKLVKIKEIMLQDVTNNLRLEVEKNRVALASYSDIENSKEFTIIKTEISLLESELESLLSNWEIEINNLKVTIEKVISKKIESPHQQQDALECTSLLGINESIQNITSKINIKGKEINLIIHFFKKSLEPEKIKNSLNKVEQEGKIIAKLVKRRELSEQCDEYLHLKMEIEKLATDIPILKEELRAEQSSFLSSYFGNINKHFSEFGSGDFTLEIGENNSGNVPVFFLKVKFKNISIAEKDLEKVFSESDRRALSLAIFWSRISAMSASEVENTIIIFDDPVTSFDNNRISSVHRKIAKLSNEARQIIILSHYEQEISKFLISYKNNKEINFISITNKNGDSSLEKEDIEKFILNDHEKSRESILNFISETDNYHSPSDLRVFFEVEISLRFAKQLRELEINEHNLSGRIEKLLEFNIISEEIAQECNSWRETLNPSHHTWVGGNIEDQRCIAKDFMAFIYEQLVPR